jgi:hypothetical protein
VTTGSYVGTNPIWGDLGSPNAQDWFQIDLGAPTRFNSLKLYFFSNKAFGSGGNTYREPTAYTVQYFDGSTWVDVPGQVKTPGTPLPNYNEVHFAPVTAQQVRLLLTRAPGFAVGLKEFQVQFTYDWHGFFERVADPPAVNTVTAGVSVPVKFDLGGDQGLSVLAPGFPQLQPVFCGTTTPSGAAVAAGRGIGLRYDPSTRQYVFAWTTDRAWRGTCGRLDVKLADGTTHRAFFAFA